MLPRWTLVVEGLGKIERAEIRTHPLMLFVGPNNSGKSYLASMLWGLLKLPFDFFQQEDLASEAGRAAVSVVARVGSRARPETGSVLAAEEMETLLALLNDTLRRRPYALAEAVFNASTVPVWRLAIEDFEPAMPAMPMTSAIAVAPESLTPMVASNDLGFFLREMLTGVRAAVASPSYLPGDPVFLPASRTGFMLFYKQVLGNQLVQLFRASRASPEGLKLPSPSAHFLTLLATGLPARPGPFAAEAERLERHALDGTLVMRPIGPSHDFEYQVGPDKTPLSLDLASSLVTELAPLVLVLRHIERLPVLILEEPEAHQHPAVQRIIAQTLVRLVRRGVAVWVTTHSENFCQQINNFIKLGEHPERVRLQKELGYEDEEYLRQEEVAGYQFNLLPNGYSVVTELGKSDQGLTMPTFNDPLRKLAKETLALERLTSDEEAE